MEGVPLIILILLYVFLSCLHYFLKGKQNRVYYSRCRSITGMNSSTMISVPCSKLSSLFSSLFLVIPYILSLTLCSPLYWHFYTTTYVNSKPCSLRGNSLSSATLSSTNLVLWNPSVALCNELSFFATLNNAVPSKPLPFRSLPSFPVYFCKYQPVQAPAQIPLTHY